MRSSFLNLAVVSAGHVARPCWRELLDDTRSSKTRIGFTALQPQAPSGENADTLDAHLKMEFHEVFCAARKPKWMDQRDKLWQNNANTLQFPSQAF